MFAVSAVDRRAQAAVLALTEASRGPWHQVADVVEEAGSALAVVKGTHVFEEESQRIVATRLAERTTGQMIERWAGVIERTVSRSPGLQLLTVIDAEYPCNLRRIYDRPPFLFVRGALLDEDVLSVAVVGTRRPSERGCRLASHMAGALAERGVTIVSGLAAGIDTEAHTAAIQAGGRTIAVMGTGIDRVYPRENAALAERITRHGALLSQFWPGAPPRGSNFPLRNVVSSGMAIGTVVIEASSTSGAKMQARLALEHGKRLFLVESLVMQEQWAQRYAARRGAKVVHGVEDVIAELEAEQTAITELQLF